MDAPKCFRCGGKIKPESKACRTFQGKYIISDAKARICARCGEEYINAKEYERIRKKISSAKGKIPAPQQMIVKAKFLIL